MNSANWFLPTVHSSVLHLPSSAKMAQQQIRQNYHEECEALVNKQINMQLYASHVYIALSSYFTRADQALPGFAHFFRKFSNAERNHGGALLEYQARRGVKMLVVLALAAIAAAEPEAEAKAAADPYLYGYGGYGLGYGYGLGGYYGGYGLGYYGKREAEAEPKAAADPYLYGYGGYGLGYGYSLGGYYGYYYGKRE